MYRFLIIDDEPVVREGISETIEWERHGFELVGACRDGREGLAAVEELRPDVVLTDVCMPFVDGLELAATIGDQYPTIKTILLTGFDEFEYAQEAVKLKVRDFLLKPITADELRSVLDSLREEIDRERDHHQKLEHLDAQLRASLPVYRERFLNRLVRGGIASEEMERSIALLDIDLPGPDFIALIADIDPAAGHQSPAQAEGSDDRVLALAVREIADELTAGIAGGVVFSTATDETVQLISVRDDEDTIVRALHLAEEIADRVQREISRTVSIGIGEVVTALEEIHHSYRDARTALEQRFVLGANQIITIQQARGGAGRTVASGEPESRGRFITALKTGTGDIEGILRETLGALRFEGEEIDHYHVTMHRLLADTINALEVIGLDYRELEAFRGNPFAQLSRIKTLAEAEAWFLSVVREAQGILDGRRQQHSQRKAIAATEYIDGNYQNPDLSIQEVCNVLAVSKSYLSPIFKAHTGTTFVEYLTARRTERAKDLLGAGKMKVYEVAGQVGFRDAHYFSLTFKKQAGVTPREYQELVRRGSS